MFICRKSIRKILSPNSVLFLTLMVTSFSPALSAKESWKLNAHEKEDNRIIEQTLKISRGHCAAGFGKLSIKGDGRIRVDVFGRSMGRTLCLPMRQKVYIAVFDARGRRVALHLTIHERRASFVMKNGDVFGERNVSVTKLVGKRAKEPLYSLSD